jgi:hypothetical protein
VLDVELEVEGGLEPLGQFLGVVGLGVLRAGEGLGDAGIDVVVGGGRKRLLTDLAELLLNLLRS